MSKTKKVARAVVQTVAGDCCLGCAFYMLPGRFCRRYPAQPVASKTERNGSETIVTEWQSAFPVMLPTGWCGEWRARPAS